MGNGDSTENNVVTVAFKAKRDPAVARAQLELLIQRVLAEKYRGDYYKMLGDYGEVQFLGYKLTFKEWLQEQLGAVAVSKPTRLH